MGFLSAFKHIGRGLLFAAIGLGIGVAFGSLIAEITGREPLQVRVAIGYVFPLIGWLLGVGLWDVLAREWFGFEPKPHDNQGWERYFSFSLDHKVIGVQYLVTFMILFLLAGLLAILIRVELMDAGQNFVSANDFNTTMSLHGIIMVAVAVAVAAIMGGFGNFMLPLLIGADDVAFPRINALSYWMVPPVAGANPWRARTLEWQTTSPPPHENFDHPPVVTGDPYGYGVPGSIHADMNPPLPGGAPASGDGD